MGLLNWFFNCEPIIVVIDPYEVIISRGGKITRKHRPSIDFSLSLSGLSNIKIINPSHMDATIKSTQRISFLLDAFVNAKGEPATPADIEYIISDPSVVDVVPGTDHTNGFINALIVGKTDVTFQVKGKSGALVSKTVTITVDDTVVTPPVDTTEDVTDFGVTLGEAEDKPAA